MTEEKTIEQIAGEHCSPDSQSCIIGLIVARNGEFFQTFALEFDQNVTPDDLQAALIDAATQLNISLRMFDEEKVG